MTEKRSFKTGSLLFLKNDPVVRANRNELISRYQHSWIRETGSGGKGAMPFPLGPVLFRGSVQKTEICFYIPSSCLES